MYCMKLTGQFYLNLKKYLNVKKVSFNDVYIINCKQILELM